MAGKGIAMISDLLQGIVDSVFNLYGGKVPIYITQLKQDFTAPCFFIEFVDSTPVQDLNNRYHSDITFQVSYYPEEDESGSPDYLDVSKQIMPLEMALHEITLRDGSLIRSKETQSTINDNVLHVSVTYEIHYYVPPVKAPLMQTLKQNQTTKE